MPPAFLSLVFLSSLYICASGHAGKQTDPGDITKIREAVKEKKEACLCLLNYKKDGSIFHNQFFLTPLFDAEGKLVSALSDRVAPSPP